MKVSTAAPRKAKNKTKKLDSNKTQVTVRRPSKKEEAKTIERPKSLTGGGAVTEEEAVKMSQGEGDPRLQESLVYVEETSNEPDMTPRPLSADSMKPPKVLRQRTPVQATPPYNTPRCLLYTSPSPRD